MPINGLVTMTPTSIASTGTGNSSSINTNGSVTFSTCATLSLNGVFTSSYDNYMLVVRHTHSTSSAGVALQFRLRASGTDNSTASSYVSQLLESNGTTLTALRGTTTFGYISLTTNVQREGATTYLFGPQLAQATAWRSVAVYGVSSAGMYDVGGTHNQATAYDGITIYPPSGSITGLVTVYGFNQ